MKFHKSGGSFTGGLYKIPIPNVMNDSEKSITCRLSWVIVKSHMPKSAFYRRTGIRFQNNVVSIVVIFGWMKKTSLRLKVGQSVPSICPLVKGSMLINK